MVKHRKGVNQRKRQANKRGEAGPAREEEQADEKLQRARELLASFEENGGSSWSKEQCDQIIEAAEALPELTATENQLYGRAPGTGHTSHILFETNPLQPYPFRLK